ncbi:integrase family protein [Shimia sp. CNT1-13L.2]|uniref:tyrosine-type recombinase/integrase n=1 Tax=Shimia sp. CNT1-13L.2 TaxID=2959663 RepID=UPI0020CBC373|nr:integrase family protein [Shimia sp. CNT1-13L.2]MCP9481674.1 integrase family protein [Shimia sp. CNT1-13L.2]
MSKMKLTKASIDALPHPDNGQKIHWDSEQPGFGVRVTPGAKTYIAQNRVGGKTRRVKVASVGTLSVAEARKEAQKQLGQMATGIDVNKAKTEAKAKGITLKEAKTKFLDKPKLGEKSRYDYGRVFITYFSDWNDKALKDITSQMFAKRFTKLQQENGQATANKALRVFRSMWNYTRTVHLVDGMPILPECPIFIVKAEGAYEEVSRREATVLDALPAWFDCLENLDTAAHKPAGDAFKDYVALLLRTGLRASEAASMRWEDIDLDVGTFTVRNTKNGTDHTLPIVPQVAAIFERRREAQTEGFVFPANGRTGHLGQPRKYLDKHRKAMGLHWNLHDLRRSFATVATTAKIDGYTLKALLNHSRKSNDVTAGYVNLSAEDLREPMQKINDHLDELAQGKI